jgi:hypothetical protein
MCDELNLKCEISRQLRGVEENGFGYMNYIRDALFDPDNDINWDKVYEAFRKCNPETCIT